VKKLFLTAILCLWTYAAFAADTIKIGLLAPITGAYASEGQGMKQVLELLTADVNAKGGILGKQVTLITEDDGSDPRTAALAANKLISQGVVAVIGTYGSSVTEPTQGILDESGIVQIANGATAIRLTEKGLKMFFRTCPRDHREIRLQEDRDPPRQLHLCQGPGRGDQRPVAEAGGRTDCFLRRSYSRGERLQHDSDQAEAGSAPSGFLYRLL
jgi:hypothetical protein